MGKRESISFKTVVEGKVTPIDREVLRASSNQIRQTMTVVVRKYKKSEARSLKHAGKLVLNS